MKVGNRKGGGRRRLRELINGYWHTQMIYAACRLSLAEHLSSGPLHYETLARKTGSNPRTLYRLLRGLASLGIFAEDVERRFALTPLASYLSEKAPGSMKPAALMMGEERYRAWADLLHSVRTGENAFAHCFGEQLFAYQAKTPRAARLFDAAMTSIHGAETRAVLEAYPLAGLRELIDVGGGNGSMLFEILHENPSMRGTVFDLPEVVERTRERVQDGDLRDRVRVVGGSFFKEVPGGGDAYLLRHILHDWDDNDSTTILRTCRSAMPPDSRLLVIECVISEGNDPEFGKLQDLNMLVVPGGQERTAQEFRELFQRAGFLLSDIVRTSQDVCVLEGRPKI